MEIENNMSSFHGVLFSEEEVKERLLRENIEIKKCKFCGDSIIFMKRNDGKVVPMSLDLKNHSFNCSTNKRYNKNSRNFYHRKSGNFSDFR
jgi:hypothetical protein